MMVITVTETILLHLLFLTRTAVSDSLIYYCCLFYDNIVTLLNRIQTQEQSEDATSFKQTPRLAKTSWKRDEGSLLMRL